ncbi:MAG: hypothetical protein KDA28_08670, partial [Phycisphaerales bacterium]|nr:hypothetical protein [Phycisphaerales bacterium]
MFENLESRVLFGAAFVSVGFLSGFDDLGFPTANVFVTEGTRSGDHVDGIAWFDGTRGREYDGNLWYDHVREASRDRLERHEGSLGWTWNDAGAEYGATPGWWIGEYDPDTFEAEFVVERALDARPEDFQGEWTFAMLGFNGRGGYAYSTNGEFTIDDGDLDWDRDRGRLPSSWSGIDSYESDGTMRTFRGEWFYLSADHTSMVFADLRSEDGDIFIGIASREGYGRQRHELVGTYNLLLGDTIHGPWVRARELDLRLDGTYDIDDVHGRRLQRGIYTLEGSLLTLHDDDSSQEFRFRISDDASSLIGENVKKGWSIDPLVALGSRQGGPGWFHTTEAVVNTWTLDVGGRATIHQLEDVWVRVELDDAIDVETWTTHDGLGRAVAVTERGLMLYEERLDDTWDETDLAWLARGDAIVEELEIMRDGRRLHVSGLDASGDLVLYTLDGHWSFQRLDLGALDWLDYHEAYATPWGGLNIAGVDDEGSVWAAWWAPGLGAWRLNNLTDAYGNAPVAGALTVYQTTWKGINIAGVDHDGHLRVTWWVPELGGEWRQADLTVLGAGDALEPHAVTSFVTGWDAFN